MIESIFDLYFLYVAELANCVCALFSKSTCVFAFVAAMLRARAGDGSSDRILPLLDGFNTGEVTKSLPQVPRAAEADFKNIRTQM